MGVACLEFHGENFRGSLKNREIRESFLPRKFPAIRYPIWAQWLRACVVPRGGCYYGAHIRISCSPSFVSDSLSEMASDDLKGYDCNFVDPVPTSLVCLICRLIARAPQQMVCCGKVYCKACLSDLKASRANALCPQCRKKIKSFPDMRGENTI